MLPFLNGYEVCKQIRTRKDIPILLLTAKDEVQDKVFGLDLPKDTVGSVSFNIQLRSQR